ncbi:NAD(P)-binding domain-containing protein [Cellulomonas sp.]|uniref:NAD(P)-binding domain-containing protein n=1 Tax=Cellulomonas sp. TaxID=40001 RepID=UPI001B25282D|nr:NAD(P)-binding domain-containing protein [Cellulomonas sp.]MBO9556479.1 NAD(P)-binding domain-containing protein [Cellulomonas sp.]
MGTVDCVVVGAGPAGLAASAALAAEGVEHVVLERGRVGESWRAHRWDSFRLNTPGSMNRLLGPLPDDEYTGRQDVVRRLDDVAGRCPVRAAVDVTGIAAHDGSLTLTTSDGPVHARSVVVATGAENVPRLPPVAHTVPRRIHQETGASYRNPGALPDGAVLVVGSGQTGAQIVEDLHAAGRRVLLSASPVGRLPTPYRGRPMIEWLREAGFFDQRPEDLPDRAMTRMPNPLLPPGGDHDLDLRRLAVDGVELVGRVTGASDGRLHVDRSVGDSVAFAEAFAERARSMADRAIERLGLDVAPAEPEEPIDHPVRDVDELDLRAEGITSVVWCTGMGGSHDWLPDDLLDGGVPRHSSGRSPLAGLWFVGLRWMVRRCSSNLVGMPGDAAATATAVSAHLAGRR